MNTLAAFGLGSLGAAGFGAYQAAQLGARKPGRTPSGESLEQLAEAMDKRIDQIAPGKSKPELGLATAVPSDSDNLRTIMKDTSPYASNSKQLDVDNGFNININPNADRAYLAHELGHVASYQTPVGRMVRNARENPKLTRALGIAGGVGAAAYAAGTPGDDDLAASVAMTYATALPEIADEFLANKNALAIMDTANMRATAGQRGRLAGGMLTYLGAPLLIGVGANIAGNFVDADQQTSGTAQMF